METNIQVSEEELAEETEAQAAVDEEEIRDKVLSDLGIEDNDDNKELIDKLVTRETEHRTKLSKAIGQKVKFRDQLKGDKKTPDKKTDQKVDPVEAAQKAVEEKFMQRDLDDMDHSDSIKEQIKRIAQLQDISIRKAEKDPYIKHLIAEDAKAKSVDDAAKNGKRNSSSKTVIDVSKPLDPADFDLSTEEGRAEWQEAKKARAAARA